MQTQRHDPQPVTGTLTPDTGLPGQASVGCDEQDFAERHDDPEQAEELERQQDA
ncbi:hypothetical protein [Limnohabitans sp. T6-5]|uniref:hypothetical protein n=1 Tax=Limnohabitans sp. T6-5 TaxID=1100724 RepID=UPI001304C635|nr:hypothetical protein [Limnohabitans sp. T6-5]